MKKRFIVSVILWFILSGCNKTAYYTLTKQTNKKLLLLKSNNKITDSLSFFSEKYLRYYVKNDTVYITDVSTSTSIVYIRLRKIGIENDEFSKETPKLKDVISIDPERDRLIKLRFDDDTLFTKVIKNGEIVQKTISLSHW